MAASVPEVGWAFDCSWASRGDSLSVTHALMPRIQTNVCSDISDLILCPLKPASDGATRHIAIQSSAAEIAAAAKLLEAQQDGELDKQMYMRVGSMGGQGY